MGLILFKYLKNIQIETPVTHHFEFSLNTRKRNYCEGSEEDNKEETADEDAEEAAAILLQS